MTPLLLALLLAAPADSQRAVDKAFQKVERHLNGSDTDIRQGCGKTTIKIDDRPLEYERSLERRESEISMEGVQAADFRLCVRAIARAGVIDGWKLVPSENGYRLTLRLLRARRDPRLTGIDRREKSDKEAAAALDDLWKEHRPVPEVAATELLAPDLVSLDEASWNAGNIAIRGRARTQAWIDAYTRLLEPVLAGGPKPQIELDAFAPDSAPSGSPSIAETGLLRGAVRDATAGTILRLFAELDRRDFVVPSGGDPHTGSVGGSWNGLLVTLAKAAKRVPLDVGGVNALAPEGHRPHRMEDYTGAHVTLALQAADPAKVFTILGVAGKTSITIGGIASNDPAAPSLPPVDVQVKNVPWDQVLDAIAVTDGCTVAKTDVRCDSLPPPSGRGPGGGGSAMPSLVSDSKSSASASSQGRDGIAALPPPSPLPEGGGDRKDLSAIRDLSPLERAAVSEMTVIAIGNREGKTLWRAIVRTPEGLDVLVRTGTLLGKDGGHAVVDEHGVSLVLERYDSDGNPHLIAVPVPF